MNKRIRELAEQARCFTETYDNELLSEPALLYCFHEDDFKKFAELIVRECVAICEDTEGDPSADSRWGRRCCALEIKEHFGVAE